MAVAHLVSLNLGNGFSGALYHMPEDYEWADGMIAHGQSRQVVPSVQWTLTTCLSTPGIGILLGFP